MAILMLQQPTAGATERTVELWSCRLKVKTLEKQSEEAIYKCALADKRANKSNSDAFRAEDRGQESKSGALQRSEPSTRGEVEKGQAVQ